MARCVNISRRSPRRDRGFRLRKRSRSCGTTSSESPLESSSARDSSQIPAPAGRPVAGSSRSCGPRGQSRRPRQTNQSLRRSSTLAVCVALFAPHGRVPTLDPGRHWATAASTRPAVTRMDLGAVGDTCATLPPATDTIQYRVYATLEAPARKDTLPATYVQSVIDGLRHGFTVPNPLTLGAYAPFVSGMNGVMTPTIFGEVEFTLDARGKASDIHLTQSSLSGALDRAIYDAPRHADSLGAFPATDRRPLPREDPVLRGSDTVSAVERLRPPVLRGPHAGVAPRLRRRCRSAPRLAADVPSDRVFSGSGGQRSDPVRGGRTGRAHTNDHAPLGRPICGLRPAGDQCRTQVAVRPRHGRRLPREGVDQSVMENDHHPRIYQLSAARWVVIRSSKAGLMSELWLGRSNGSGDRVLACGRVGYTRRS